jgi:hypothetical protein
MTSSQQDFVRLFNPDGTTDSVCAKCGVTVRTAPWQVSMDSTERDHKCDPSRLELRKSAAEKIESIEESTDRVLNKWLLPSRTS